VLTSVDLDRQPDVLPADVEIDAASGQRPHHLAARLRETTCAAHAREVQLSERVGAVAEVTENVVNESSAFSADSHRAGRPRLEESGWRREPLLEHEAQNQRGLTVGGSPDRGMHRRMRHVDSWDPGASRRRHE
jgi:hypothetical protein